MKRPRVKFAWDLYWVNKTNKLNRSIAHEIIHSKVAQRNTKEGDKRNLQS